MIAWGAIAIFIGIKLPELGAKLWQRPADPEDLCWRLNSTGEE
jgi:hypothetical protein